MVASASLVRWSIVAVLPPLVGCYTYAEASLESLAPGRQTRVRLDAEGFGRVVSHAAMNGVPVERLDLAGHGGAVLGALVYSGTVGRTTNSVDPRDEERRTLPLPSLPLR